MITDIPAWLKDGRLSDVEMQKVAQEFIFTRTELYASDMLLLQYSVEEGQAKSEMNFKRVKEAVVVVLMVDSPQVFKDFESDRYIHRFIDRVADRKPLRKSEDQKDKASFGRPLSMLEYV